MIERKIEMNKDKVTKSIDENLVSIYENMGWTKVNSKRNFEVKDEKPQSKGFMRKTSRGL